jgi:hypothetical protein
LAILRFAKSRSSGLRIWKSTKRRIHKNTKVSHCFLVYFLAYVRLAKFTIFFLLQQLCEADKILLVLPVQTIIPLHHHRTHTPVDPLLLFLMVLTAPVGHCRLHIAWLQTEVSSNAEFFYFLKKNTLLVCAIILTSMPLSRRLFSFVRCAKHILKV